jgi:hypothetical protein
MAPQNSFAGKDGAGDDARAHLVHDGQHLLIVGPRLLNAVGGQGLGRAAPALVQGGDKAESVRHFLKLLFGHIGDIHALFLGCRSWQFRRWMNSCFPAPRIARRGRFIVHAPHTSFEISGKISRHEMERSFAASPSGVRFQELVNTLHGHSAFAHGGGTTLDRSGSHVTRGENSRMTGFHIARGPAKSLPSR